MKYIANYLTRPRKANRRSGSKCTGCCSKEIAEKIMSRFTTQLIYFCRCGVTGYWSISVQKLPRLEIIQLMFCAIPQLRSSQLTSTCRRHWRFISAKVIKALEVAVQSTATMQAGDCSISVKGWVVLSIEPQRHEIAIQTNGQNIRTLTLDLMTSHHVATNCFVLLLRQG